MTAQRAHRPIQAIKELRIRGAADVSVKRGEPSMTVIAENPEAVVTEIRDGILTISQKPTLQIGGGVMHAAGDNCIQIGSIRGDAFHGNMGSVVVGNTVVIGQHVSVEITLPDLRFASIEGSGGLNLEELHQDEIDLEVTGSGTIRASGEVIRLHAVISGSGDVKAQYLQAAITELRVTGSGDIKAQASESLSARVSGSGDIKVWGNPAKRDTRVSGSGDIKFK